VYGIGQGGTSDGWIRHNTCVLGGGARAIPFLCPLERSEARSISLVFVFVSPHLTNRSGTGANPRLSILFYEVQFQCILLLLGTLFYTKKKVL
jgi:hypothetical protein